MATKGSGSSSMACGAVHRQTPEAGARCVNRARRDLCGGYPVTGIPTATFTHPNAIVLDPFAGSGSTCVAALQSGRRYIGIELLEQYHRAGQQRLAAVQRAMQQGAANDDWFMPEAA